MAPPKGDGYRPLDLESSSHTGQWRTIEEHERLQQEGAVPSTANASDPEFGDYYGQRKQHVHQSRKNITWIIGGCFVVLLVVVAASIASPHSFSYSSSTQPTGSIRAGPKPNPDSTTKSGSQASSSVSEKGNRASGASSTSSAHAVEATGSNSSHGVWHEGGVGLSTDQVEARPEGYVPCEGPDLQCAVVNKQPIPEADFRNLPRRATAAGSMVASDNSRCGQIGRDVLGTGGNAVDASVAVALCLGVVNPVSSGLGGGAFITIRLANGTAGFFDARETAPAAATEDMYTGLPANASLFGGLSVAVPVELQGLEAAWKRFGTKPWAQLVKPAADLARTGFAAHPYLVYIMSGEANLNRMKATKSLREAFLIQDPSGDWRAPKVGELCCKRTKLAETLDNIASQGAAYLTSPAVTAAHAAELSSAGGIITAQDLAGAAPQERELLRMQLGELELLIPPPPSSAAVVGFVLKFLAGYGNTLINGTASSSSSSTSSDIAVSAEAGKPAPEADAAESKLASFGAEPKRDKALGMHRMVEAFKHGFAVRTALGDPGTKQRPFPESDKIHAAVRDLLSDTFVDHLRALTSDDTVLQDLSYGGRWNPEGVAPPEEHGTSHFCVVDGDRNAVSLTSSINTPFGSGVISDTTGILFGNTMDDFASPSKRTLVTPHPSKANFIEPGRRPLSAMSPIIVTHRASGRLVAVAGASGGPLIVSATAQTLARLLLEGADVRRAVAAPRLHDQLVPSNVSFVEEYTWGHTHHEMSNFVLAQLEARDQSTKAVGFGLGVLQAIYVDYGASTSSVGSSGGRVGLGSSSRGVLVGASDSRKDGAPIGLD